MSDATVAPAEHRRNLLVDHLARDLERVTKYHDHKETMAWTGTAASFGVVGIGHLGVSYVHGPPSKAILLLVCLFAVAIAYVFVNMQFEGRWLAADDIATLRRAKLWLIDADPTALSNLEVQPRASVDGDDHASQFPAFVLVDNQASLARRRKAIRDLLEAVRRDGLEVRLDGTNRRARSEVASYSAIVLVALLCAGEIILHTA